MTIVDDNKLDEYEDADIFDVIVKLEHSFAIEFGKEAFKNVKTFGDLCDVIESHIQYENSEDCTSQHAFYKIQAAISETRRIDKKLILPDTQLADLFPRQYRRRQVKAFQQHLGVRLQLLTYPGWLFPIFIAGFLASFIAFFVDWKIALSGIIFFAVALTIADKLGKELAIGTVKELTIKATTEHYIEMKSAALTVNRNEITDIIKEAFSTDLGINKKQLTRDAKLSWA